MAASGRARFLQPGHVLPGPASLGCTGIRTEHLQPERAAAVIKLRGSVVSVSDRNGL